MAAALAAGALMCGWTAPSVPAQQGVGKPQITRIPPSAPNVTIVIVPRGTSVAELARMPGMALGVMSAGIGEVPSEQTFLDISQGNRIDDGLYDQALPGLFPFAREVPGWSDAIDRARDAPADIVPGLLTSQLQAGGVPSSAERPMVASALVAADRRGIVSPFRPRECARGCPGLSVVSATNAELAALVRRLRGDDLLIALASPPPAIDGTIPIGVAGRGFDGNLTSDSTRTNGYVLSTDLAPTILWRLGLGTPDEMDGEPIRSEGSTDPRGVADRAERMAAIPDRRAPVVIVCLVAWILVAAAVALVRPMYRRVALSWLALAFAYMSLMLLAGAAIRPSAFAEGLLVGFGAAALAAVTVRLTRGWWALAVACAITVLAYAIDVLAGSGLTKLSLLGPNPIFGVRFYGIGNELEALIAVMVPVAVGAGLTAAGERWPISRRVAVGAFLAAGGLTAVIFAAGRFGADVGAAIVLPAGAAVAGASIWSLEGFSPYTGEKSTKLSRRRTVAPVIAAPIVALAALAFIDLVSGGNAHLTRSVLDAGGAGDLADVAERRLRLSAHDFAQAAGNPLFWVVVVGIAVALARLRHINAWLEPAPLARAGVIGACAAVAVGVLVNDSGATFLTLGTLALGATLAFAWAQAGTDP
jgi:hypothetical protein